MIVSPEICRRPFVCVQDFHGLRPRMLPCQWTKLALCHSPRFVLHGGFHLTATVLFVRPSIRPVGRGPTEMVERPTLFSCRYKIPHQDGMTLADVFGHFEVAKAKVRI